MSTLTVHTNTLPASTGGAADTLHRMRELVLQDPGFAAALADTASPQEAADLAARHGLMITPEALWRNRGRLMLGGKPTWRG